MRIHKNLRLDAQGKCYMWGICGFLKEISLLFSNLLKLGGENEKYVGLSGINSGAWEHYKKISNIKRNR